MSEEDKDDYSDVVGLTDAELESLNEDEAEDVEETEDESVETEEAEGEAQQEAANIDEQFIPQYKAEASDSIGDAYKALDDSYANLSDKLDEQYEAGELSFIDYRKQTRELDSKYFAEKSSLDTARIKAEIATEQSTQIAEQKWQWEQDMFFRDNPDFKSDTVLFGALNATLQALYGDQASAGKSGLQLIREAADKVRARLDVKSIPNNQQQVPDRRAERKPVNLPKTLSNIPSAESNIENGGEFDYMDKLSSRDYESAVKKLSPEQHERWLRS